MIVVTTEHIEGYKVVDVKGPVFGLIVRSRGLGGDIMAGLKGLVGGEIMQYTAMLEDSRKEAIDRMIKNAHQMGANAIIMMRFDSGEMGRSMSEIVAYGTAVVLEKL
ncbi:YbjQ family protein [Solibacillus sp. CAU 1738]|uniref:YbjQ family protein n=1 Tax=Solibacillus sp. CAU 1738 TaxID=3140363 RepID=UPI00326053B5